jgi:uncharacterized protein YqeY
MPTYAAADDLVKRFDERDIQQLVVDDSSDSTTVDVSSNARVETALDDAEGEVIAKYLPAQLSEDDVKKLIAAAIASTGAAGPADMGKVMGILKVQVAGKADGGMVSTLVKAALAGGN